MEFLNHGTDMKIETIFPLLFLATFSFAQERSREELLELETGNEKIKPASLCSDVEWPPNSQCFDFPPAVPIIEAIRSVLGDDVFVNVITLVELEVFTEDVGLTTDEIRRRLEPVSLNDGRSLYDIVFIVEGEIPEHFYSATDNLP